MTVKTDKKSRKPGAAYAREAGLVSVQLLVAPAERDRIRVAAARAGLSMGAFARRVVVEAAKGE